MLAALRRNSRNAIIYVLFGVLIAAFVISFGPGSRGFGVSGPTTMFAAKVGGSSVTEQDFHFGWVVMNGPQIPLQYARERRLKEFVMDRLIERELFANEAERLGFSVSEKEAEDVIAQGRLIALGMRRRIDMDPVFGYAYKNGNLDYERLKMVAQNSLGVTVKRLREIEQRELLAEKVREILRLGTKVSPDDVKSDFESKGLQVNLEFARFPARKYEDEAAEPTDAEIDAYVKTHGDELKKLYDERSFLYKNVDKQAKLRHVVVDALKTADAATVAAAKKKIDEAAVKVKAGTPFAQVAQQLSTDERGKKRGGEMGWRKKGLTGFGDALDGKIFAAKKGDVVGPERTDRGFELVLVEDFREGDVPLLAAERELGAEEVRKQKSKDKAKAEAQALLDRVHKGEKLEQIVPKATPNPNETPEEKQMKAFMAKSSEPVHLEETGLFSRRGDIVQDIGVSKELSKRAFELKVGEIAGPFDVGTGWAVVRVKEHHDPDLADYAKRKNELERQYEISKWERITDEWAKQKCAELRDEKRIKVNSEVLDYDGGKTAVKYEPCAGTKLF